jgi:hypothetical protein
LVPGGRRLVKSAYLTNARTKRASTTYAGRTKEKYWQEDEMSDIVNMERQLVEVVCRKECVDFECRMNVFKILEREFFKQMVSTHIYLTLKSLTVVL